VLEQVVAWRGQPGTLRIDNGPEFLVDSFAGWGAKRGIALRYMPLWNGLTELSGMKCWMPMCSPPLDLVREISAQGMQECNEEQPHDTLDGTPPTVSDRIGS